MDDESRGFIIILLVGLLASVLFVRGVLRYLNKLDQDITMPYHQWGSKQYTPGEGFAIHPN